MIGQLYLCRRTVRQLRTVQNCTTYGVYANRAYRVATDNTEKTNYESVWKKLVQILGNMDVKKQDDDAPKSIGVFHKKYQAENYCEN